MWSDAIPMGTETGPVSPSNYKRAVLKPPPREFTIEVLSPTKHGSNFSYGLKICPIFRSKRSSDSRSTTSSYSNSSYSEYEIWRRWEDCLDFQETLEAEYSQMSRQKVKVLKRGATGKKRSDDLDGPYTLHKAAASFDSLPEGPDPREVAVDVHKLIPQLSRKGTLFRVSRSTLKQRGEEFAAMIHALFDSSEDAPVLLQELRNCSAVRDFFGFWRRDKELLKKSGKDVSRMFHSNHSLSSLSTSFSLSTTPSSPASSVFPATPTSPAAHLRHSMFTRLAPRGVSEYGGERMAPGPPMPASAPPASRRFVPDSPITSQFPSTSHHDQHADGADVTAGSMLFTDELLLGDDSGPSGELAEKRRPLTHVTAPKSAPLWGSYDVRDQVSRPTNAGATYPIPEDDLPRPLARARSISSAAPGYRNARIFVSAPNSPVPLLKPTEPSFQEQLGEYLPPGGRPASPSSTNHNRDIPHLLSPISSLSSSHPASVSSRPSSLSMNRFSVTSSVSSYNQPGSKRSSSSQDSRRSFDSESCVDLDLTFPNSPIILHTPLSEIAESRNPRFGHRSRDSTSSFASCRTESSADGVLPLHLRSPPTHQRKRSLSWESRPNNTTSMMDSRAPSLVEESMSENGEDLIDSYFDDFVDGHKLSMEGVDRELPRFISHGGKHSVSSISSAGSFITNESQPSWSPRDDAFAVKAVYHESVVVFRAERSMSLATIRQRIRERLALHEGVPLDENFVLAYLPSRAPLVNAGVTVRRGRSNSVASSTADVSQLCLLQAEVDWQVAMTTCGGKVTLRLLDASTTF